jgi:hypothetical protein
MTLKAFDTLCLHFVYDNFDLSSRLAGAAAMAMQLCVEIQATNTLMVIIIVRKAPHQEWLFMDGMYSAGKGQIHS